MLMKHTTMQDQQQQDQQARGNAHATRTLDTASQALAHILQKLQPLPRRRQGSQQQPLYSTNGTMASSLHSQPVSAPPTYLSAVASVQSSPTRHSYVPINHQTAKFQQAMQQGPSSHSSPRHPPVPLASLVHSSAQGSPRKVLPLQLAATLTAAPSLCPSVHTYSPPRQLPIDLLQPSRNILPEQIDLLLPPGLQSNRRRYMPPPLPSLSTITAASQANTLQHGLPATVHRYQQPSNLGHASAALAQAAPDLGYPRMGLEAQRCLARLQQQQHDQHNQDAQASVLSRESHLIQGQPQHTLDTLDIPHPNHIKPPSAASIAPSSPIPPSPLTALTAGLDLLLPLPIPNPWAPSPQPQPAPIQQPTLLHATSHVIMHAGHAHGTSQTQPVPGMHGAVGGPHTPRMGPQGFGSVTNVSGSAYDSRMTVMEMHGDNLSSLLLMEELSQGLKDSQQQQQQLQVLYQQQALPLQHKNHQQAFPPLLHAQLQQQPSNIQALQQLQQAQMHLAGTSHNTVANQTYTDPQGHSELVQQHSALQALPMNLHHQLQQQQPQHQQQQQPCVQVTGHVQAPMDTDLPLSSNIMQAPMSPPHPRQLDFSHLPPTSHTSHVPVEVTATTAAPRYPGQPWTEVTHVPPTPHPTTTTATVPAAGASPPKPDSPDSPTKGLVLPESRSHSRSRSQFQTGHSSATESSIAQQASHAHAKATVTVSDDNRKPMAPQPCQLLQHQASDKEDPRGEQFHGENVLLQFLLSKALLARGRRRLRAVMGAWRRWAHQSSLDRMLMISVNQLHADGVMRRVIQEWRAITTAHTSGQGTSSGSSMGHPPGEPLSSHAPHDDYASGHAASHQTHVVHVANISVPTTQHHSSRPVSQLQSTTTAHRTGAHTSRPAVHDSSSSGVLGGELSALGGGSGLDMAAAVAAASAAPAAPAVPAQLSQQAASQPSSHFSELHQMLRGMEEVLIAAGHKDNHKSGSGRAGGSSSGAGDGTQQQLVKGAAANNSGTRQYGSGGGSSAGDSSSWGGAAAHPSSAGLGMVGSNSGGEMHAAHGIPHGRVMEFGDHVGDVAAGRNDQHMHSAVAHAKGCYPGIKQPRHQQGQQIQPQHQQSQPQQQQSHQVHQQQHQQQAAPGKHLAIELSVVQQRVQQLEQQVIQVIQARTMPSKVPRSVNRVSQPNRPISRGPSSAGGAPRAIIAHPGNVSTAAAATAYLSRGLSAPGVGHAAGIGIRSGSAGRQRRVQVAGVIAAPQGLWMNKGTERDVGMGAGRGKDIGIGAGRGRDISTSGARDGMRMSSEGGLDAAGAAEVQLQYELQALETALLQLREKQQQVQGLQQVQSAVAGI